MGGGRTGQGGEGGRRAMMTKECGNTLCGCTPIYSSQLDTISKTLSHTSDLLSKPQLL